MSGPLGSLIRRNLRDLKAGRPFSIRDFKDLSGQLSGNEQLPGKVEKGSFRTSIDKVLARKRASGTSGAAIAAKGATLFSRAKTIPRPTRLGGGS